MARKQWEVYNMATKQSVSEPMTKTAALKHLNEMVWDWRNKSASSHTAPKGWRYRDDQANLDIFHRERVITRTLKHRNEPSRHLSVRPMSEKVLHEHAQSEREACQKELHERYVKAETVSPPN